MSAVETSDRPGLNEIRERLSRLSEADWVRSMVDYYQQHGHFRPADLRRLLGDPSKPIEIGPNASLPRYFCSG